MFNYFIIIKLIKKYNVKISFKTFESIFVKKLQTKFLLKALFNLSRF